MVVQFCLLQSVPHSSTVLHSRARPATARTRPQLGNGEGVVVEVEEEDDTEEEDEKEEVTEVAGLGGPVTPAATLLRPRLTLTRWHHLILTSV